MSRFVRLIVIFSIALSICAPSFAQAPGTTTDARLEELDNQVQDLLQRQAYEEALPLAKEALQIVETTRATDEDHLVLCLNHLGSALQGVQDIPAARAVFEKALKISERSHGTDAAETANCLNNLASLYYIVGDYDRARPLYERVLLILESKLSDDDKSELIPILTNLAQVVDLLEDHDRALRLYERALLIAKEHPGTDNEDLSTSLRFLGLAYLDRKRLKEGVPILQEAIALQQKMQEPDQIDLAETMSNLATAYRQLNQFDSALDLQKQARELLVKALGPDHLMVAGVLNNIGDIELQQKKVEAAQNDFLAAALIIDKHMQNVLPTLPLAEQESFVASHIPFETSVLLSTCTSGPALTKAYNLIVGWKGTLIESLRRESLVSHLAKDERTKRLVERLKNVRTQLAGWYQSAGTISYEEWKSKDDKLTNEKEEIERELVSSSRSSELADSLADVDTTKFTACIGPNEVMVDTYLYWNMTAQPSLYHYGAVLVGQDGKPSFVDLGEAHAIDTTIGFWRGAVLQEHPWQGYWTALGMLVWAPIKAKMPASAEHVYMCPDGELARVPWHLFGDNKLLMAQVDSARELMHLQHSEDNANAAKSLLIAGGVDFDANPDDKYEKPKDAMISVIKLPGTYVEMKDIEKLATTQSFKITELTGGSATRDAIVSDLPKASYVHLATHGFFFNNDFLHTVFDMNHLPSETRSVSVSERIIRTRLRERRQRNPLVESGLLLASANCRDPKTGANPGVLTAEELVGVDLTHCRLVTLSACETGRGTEVTGQGVMGLRAGLLSAGAKCVLLSLWKVPDAPTMKLMTEFYTNLWVKKLPPARALNQAQATLRSDNPRWGSSPYNWAAWVLVGKAW